MYDYRAFPPDPIVYWKESTPRVFVYAIDCVNFRTLYANDDEE